MKPLALVMLALAACARAPVVPSDSGVTGAVMIGPTCPVVRINEPCPDRPFETALRVVTDPGDDVVATARSGKDGRFRVMLAPGDYRIEAVLQQSPPSGAPVAFTVRAHQFTTVTVTLDSGIR